MTNVRGWWVTAVAAVAVGGCGNGLTNGSGSGGSLVAGPQIELQGTPVAKFDPATGKTAVVLDFIVRDAAGNSIDPATTQVRRLVDGRVADVESVPDFKDTKQAADLNLGLVLDASYSMTTWTPPAFEPMKKAALDTVQAIRGEFAATSTGTFTYSLGWFQDQYLCAPSSPTMPDGAVLDIPTPNRGDATKYLAATSAMIDRLKAQRDAAPETGRQANYALVLFTDGWDNYSWHDDSAIAPKSYPALGGSFACAGAGPTDLDAVLGRIRSFPELKVHVMGLGNEIKATELRALSTAGHGRLVTNPDSKQVAALFAEIAKEFTTVRRDGILMPLPPGTYEYAEEVTVGAQLARVRFRFRAGDAGAAVDPSSIAYF